MLTTFQKAVLATIAGSALLLAFVVAAKAPTAFASTPIPGFGSGANGSALAVYGGSGNIAPGVVTAGGATVKIRPDIAIVSAGATVQAATAAAAQAQVAERVTRILAAAKGLGVADADIQTAGYSISPTYAFDDRGGNPRITGYQAQQMVTLTMRTITDAGKALDALVQNEGATNVGIQFSLNDPKAAQAEARKLAVEDARSKAEAMARTAGVSLGKVVAISDQSVGVPFKGATDARLEFGAAAGSQIPVGDLEIVVQVQVQFAIQ
jgi:uncharacterized protein